MRNSRKYGHQSQPRFTQYVYHQKARNANSQLQFTMQYGGPPVYQTPTTGSCPTQPCSPYPPSPKQQPNIDVPPEVPEVKGLEFSTDSIRKRFIRKVYSILLIQLLLTLGSVLLFTYYPGALQFAEDHLWITVVAFVVGFAVYLSLICCSSVRYLWPHNLILLFIFTIAGSYLIGLSVSLARPELVLQAIGLTTAVVVSLTIFAIQTRWDFTMCGGILFIAGILFVALALILSFTEFGRNNVLALVISSFAVLLFGIYLIYDTQMIVGGERENTLTPEEYIAGAIMLYLDIILTFIYILQILMACED